MLTTIEMRVSTDGTSRVKPSLYFNPVAQPISQRPAMKRMNHAI